MRHRENLSDRSRLEMSHDADLWARFRAGEIDREVLLSMVYQGDLYADLVFRYEQLQKQRERKSGGKRKGRDF